MQSKLSSRLLLAVILLASGTGLAQAQSVYLGINAGISNWNVDWIGFSSSDKSDSGSRFYVGYNFTDEWGAELYYINLGKTTATPAAEVKGAGFGLAGVYNLRFGSDKEWDMIARIGLASMKAEGKGPCTCAGDKTSAQALVGIGIGYEVTKNIMLRADLDITAVKTADDQNSGVSLLSGGITFKF